MKVCTYVHQSSRGPVKRLGILLDDETIIDPNNVWACEYERKNFYNVKDRADYKIPSSLYQLLSLYENPLELLQESYNTYLYLEKLGILELEDGTPICFNLEADADISLTMPLDKIATYRDFYTHEKHVKIGFKKRNEEIPPAWYEIPAYYKGATAGFIGPGEEILWPSYTDILDYELELAMVVGKPGKNIKEKDALSHVFGFTILNDISARDIQKKEMSIRLGPAKGKDFCSIIGPVISTIDEFANTEPDLLMTAKVNGVEWSRGRSADAHFSWAQMIAHTSNDEWILPGDLFGSGTVGTGCGLELDKWIKPGDEIELTIEGIGTLRNIVGQKRK